MPKKSHQRPKPAPVMPLWLPVPGWPYQVTSTGPIVVKSVVRYDERNRRVGGAQIAVWNGVVRVRRRADDGKGTIITTRSVKRLREEALEAWEADQSRQT